MTPTRKRSANRRRAGLRRKAKVRNPEGGEPRRAAPPSTFEAGLGPTTRSKSEPGLPDDGAGSSQRLLVAAAQVPRHVGRTLIAIYRHTLSGLIGPVCRHLPTCSEYADEAIARYGLWAGGWMTLARLSRCHPWGTSGLDFVSEQMPARARWYAPWRYGLWRGVNERAGGARRCRRRARAPQRY